MILLAQLFHLLQSIARPRKHAVEDGLLLTARQRWGFSQTEVQGRVTRVMLHYYFGKQALVVFYLDPQKKNSAEENGLAVNLWGVKRCWKGPSALFSVHDSSSLVRSAQAPSSAVTPTGKWSQSSLIVTAWCFFFFRFHSGSKWSWKTWEEFRNVI